MHSNTINAFIFCCFLLLACNVSGQSIQRASMNSWGTSMQNGDLILSQTAGQSSATQVFHKENYLRQGFQQSSAVKMKASDWEIALFPNPNNGSFQFSVIAGEEDIRFKVTDAQGKLIHAETSMQQPQQTVTINGLSEGMYFLIVRSEEGSLKMKKFIVH